MEGVITDNSRLDITQRHMNSNNLDENFMSKVYFLLASHDQLQGRKNMYKNTHMSTSAVWQPQLCFNKIEGDRRGKL